MALIAADDCSAKVASNLPNERIHPNAAVPIPDPTFIQKEDAALPIPELPYPFCHCP